MTFLLNIIAFLFAVFVLVLAHEYGHFCVARWLGFKVEQFSIGFGKPLWHKTAKSGVKYMLAPILLGGYVKLNDVSYMSKPVWRRMVVMAAGVIFNVLLAIVIFWYIFILGFQSPKPVIGKIMQHSIAYNAGLSVNEEIKTIDGRPIRDWQQAAIAIISRFGDRGYLVINDRKLDISNWQLNRLDPDPISSLGIEPYRPYIPPSIYLVNKKSPAARIGFLAGDRVLSINDKEVDSWDELLSIIQKQPGQYAKFIVSRNKRTLMLNGKIGGRFVIAGFMRVGFLGVMPKPVKWPANLLREEHYSLFGALAPALQQVGTLLKFNFIIIGKLLTGKMNLQVLGGPITIFSATNAALSHGIEVYIGFLAILSLMLAFINILPIPSLDGGNLLLLLIEWVFRHPIPAKVHFFILRIGMLFLVTIIFIAITNDLMRLYN